MLTLSYPGAALASECGRATRAIVRCAHPRITSPLLARRLGARSAAAQTPLATLPLTLSKTSPMPMPSVSPAVEPAATHSRRVLDLWVPATHKRGVSPYAQDHLLRPTRGVDRRRGRRANAAFPPPGRRLDPARRHSRARRRPYMVPRYPARENHPRRLQPRLVEVRQATLRGHQGACERPREARGGARSAREAWAHRRIMVRSCLVRRSPQRSGPTGRSSPCRPWICLS